MDAVWITVSPGRVAAIPGDAVGTRLLRRLRPDGTDASGCVVGTLTEVRHSKGVRMDAVWITVSPGRVAAIPGDAVGTRLLRRLRPDGTDASGCVVGTLTEVRHSSL